MPKAYVIFTELIHDEEGMQAYQAASGPATFQSGAQLLAVDGAPKVLEGEWPSTRTVMLEFESMDAALAWYHSDAYQAAIPLRQAASDCNVVILSGR